jgi:hypothetical protein
MNTKTALCVIPPVEVWSQMNAIRMTHDKSYQRWPPHFNILFPFLPLDHTDLSINGGNALNVLQQLSARIQPFQCTLQNFRFFTNAKTAWLDPEMKESGDTKALDAISLNDFYTHVRQHFPQTCRGAQTPHPYAPHVSVGTWPNVQHASRDLLAYPGVVATTCDTVARESKQNISANAQLATPIVFSVDRVYIIERSSFTAPFQIRYVLRFAGGDISLLDTVAQDVNSQQMAINAAPNPQNKHGQKGGNDNKKACRSFQRGECKYGDRCKFSHTVKSNSPRAGQTRAKSPSTEQSRKKSPRQRKDNGSGRAISFRKS